MKQGRNSFSKIKIGFLGILAMTFGALFASFLFSFSPYNKIVSILNTDLGNKNTATLLQAEALQNTSKYFYFTKDQNKKLKISAVSYLVGDLDTGEVILAKDENKKLPIASVSKLMTALVVDEGLVPEEDTARVSKTALNTYGSNGGLRAGEQITTSDLLYPLLLESSNDAAEVLAEHFNRENFIEKMNDWARSLQMTQTFFADPSGLSTGNQSTVTDLFKLAKYLNEKKQNLLEITTLRSHTDKKRGWSSNNQFLHKEGYQGGKSGYTDPARQTVLSLFSLPLTEEAPRNIAIALLGSNDRLKDVEGILKYLGDNIAYGREIDRDVLWAKQNVVVKVIPVEIKEPDYVTLSFVGDIMLDRGVKSSVMKNFNGDYSALFEKTSSLKKSDIVFANLEGPVSDKGEDLRNLYSFRMDGTTVPALRGAGISIVSIANNHVGDWGRIAYIDTLSRLKENEILYTGGGLTKEEAEQPAIIEKNGIKIGFLGFSDVGPNWMEAGEEKTGLLLASDPRFHEIVANASKQVDYLIVSFHFGEEYQTINNDRQETLAHRAIDNGAKIVVGHHPHVIQDTEVYSPRSCTQSSCMGYIAYSLGNFIFDQSFSKNTMQGLLLEIKLSKEGDMVVKKNTIELNRVFQIEKIVPGKEEKIKF